MSYSGACLCGKVRIRLVGPIESIIHCHCSLCRKSSGTAYATNGFVEKSAFRIATGSDAIAAFEYRPGKWRYFCSFCGSPIYSASDHDDKRIRIRVGILDSDISERPIGHTFVTSRANWDDLDAHLPRFNAHEPGRIHSSFGVEAESSPDAARTDGQTFRVGETVQDAGARPRPTGEALVGETVRLESPDATKDGAALYDATHRGEIDDGQWVYMPYGPFQSRENMAAWLDEASRSEDPLFYVVRSTDNSRPLGMASILNVAPEHGSLELGHIWYVPKAQRTAVNTETVYLLLKECFDDLGYRRVEWKCDVLNARSERAARRLGFRFEGVFRQHFIIKGRNRDTSWFSMLDSEWSERRRNFEAVLYDPNCQASLTQLNECLS